MLLLDRIIKSLPVLYVLGAFLALASVVIIGLIQTPLAPLANGGWEASVLRSLLALPMPLVLAIYLGCDWRSNIFWCSALLSGCIFILSGPLFITAILCLVLGLLLKSTLPVSSTSTETLAYSFIPAAIIFVLILTGALRLLVLNEPFERDLMVYAMMARSWLEGMALYSEAWDHKPPALYIVYAAAIAIFGQSPLAIWSIGMVFFAITLIGIAVATERLAGPKAAVIAILAWFAFGNDLILQSNQPNVEVFMNACLVWSLALLLPVAENPERSWNIFGAGIMLFFASAFKQIAVFPAVLLAIWLFWLQISSSHEKRTGILHAAKSVLLLGLPGVLGWVGIFLAFQVKGNFEEFYYGVFGYNQSYSGSIFINFAKTILQDVRHPYYVSTFFILFLLHLNFERRNSVRNLLLLNFLGCAIMVAAPGKGFPHYYQLLLPTLAVSIGFFLSRFASNFRFLGAYIILFAPVLISFGYWTSPERPAFVKYDELGHGGESLESQEIGRWISLNTSVDTVVLHWGAEPGVYFWSTRPTIYRHSYYYPLTQGTRAREMSNDFLNQIKCNPPDIVVISHYLVDTEHPLTEFLLENYSPLLSAPSFDFFEILAGDLSSVSCPDGY